MATGNQPSLARLLTVVAAILHLHLQPAMAQSPGPDWPLCSGVSLGKLHHPGWEILQLEYRPPQQRRSTDRHGAKVTIPFLALDLQNAADGSRTVCSLGGTDRAASETEAVLESGASGCTTAWRGRYEKGLHGRREEVLALPPAARVRLDTASRMLEISQTWTCRGEDGKLTTFTGAASSSLDLNCNRGRDDGILTCSPPTLYQIGEAPLFIGPASVTGISPPPPAFPPSPAEQGGCPSDRTTFAGFHVLSMTYSPPHPQPPRSPYFPTSTRLELRNLLTGARTLCYLRATALPPDAGVLLVNGEPGNDTLARGSRNFENGCWSGEVVPTRPDGRATGERRLGQEWRWLPTATVGFHTRSLELSVRQTWACGGEGAGEEVVSGAASGRMEMLCRESGNEMVPLTCEPSGLGAGVENVSAVIVGPGSLGFSQRQGG